MDTPDLKLLKKLAQACRKAGIRTFKGYGFEFTLDDVEPVSTYKQQKQAVANKTEPVYLGVTNDLLSAESLTQEELIDWSAKPGETEARN